MVIMLLLLPRSPLATAFSTGANCYNDITNAAYQPVPAPPPYRSQSVV
ncbi:MAG: hypothetical protein H8F28_04200 [Fibrella sp.]|nr:hypothetical protein [Armatimonadota bacterium]